jgi:hypothetical protein
MVTRALVVLLMAAGAVPATPAEALLVDALQPGDTFFANEKVRWTAPPNVRVLWVRDCGVLLRDDARCRDPRNGDPRSRFSPNDAQKVDAALSAARRSGLPYHEVWLYSGGGNSNEGFEVGRVLRNHQATVRVPPNARCASACTVAFMGGFFRYIDVEQGARYLVHSASQWSNGLGPADDDLVAPIRMNPTAGLMMYARLEQVFARESARRRLRHFQQTLLLPLGREREAAESESVIKDWARRYAPPLEYPKARLEEDAHRIAAEGDPAIQDILMRIERDSMRLGIRDLRGTIAGLGPRAENALRMIEVMFQTGILETATLTRETLVQMGFVTKDYVAVGN